MRRCTTWRAGAERSDSRGRCSLCADGYGGAETGPRRSIPGSNRHVVKPIDENVLDELLRGAPLAAEGAHPQSRFTRCRRNRRARQITAYKGCASAIRCWHQRTGFGDEKLRKYGRRSSSTPAVFESAASRSGSFPWGRTIVFARGRRPRGSLHPGGHQLSVLSKTGRKLCRDAEPGDFFGEGCRRFSRCRLSTATPSPRRACCSSRSPHDQMLHDLLPGLSDRVILAHAVANIRLEKDLRGSLFNQR